MEYQTELNAALDASRSAGRLVLDAYEKFTAIPDARADISTAADRDAQELILIELTRHFPSDAFCAEEKTPTLAASSQSGSRIWIVDPIDGTRGFAKKNGEFSIMIGLVHAGKVVVGVVYEPVRDRLTYAARGHGCWRTDGGVKPVACKVSGTADLAAATLTQSRSKPGVASAQVAALRPAKTLETYSAGIKLVLVARGEADLYVNNYPAFHDWDICAGHILVEEAGGKVTGLHGQVIHYGGPEAEQRDCLLASNGVLHEKALQKWNEAGSS